MSERVNEMVRQARHALAKRGVDAQKVSADRGLEALKDTELRPPRDDEERKEFNKAWREAQTDIGDYVTRVKEKQSSPDEESEEERSTSLEARMQAALERMDGLEERATRLEAGRQ